MRVGDRLELELTLEFALVGAFILELVAEDDLDRPQRACGAIAREPDLAVSTATDPFDQFVIWNQRLVDGASGSHAPLIDLTAGCAQPGASVEGTVDSRVFAEKARFSKFPGRVTFPSGGIWLDALVTNASTRFYRTAVR